MSDDEGVLVDEAPKPRKKKKLTAKDLPPPGGFEARMSGCICPRRDNLDQSVYTSASCEMHGKGSGAEHIEWDKIRPRPL